MDPKGSILSSIFQTSSFARAVRGIVFFVFAGFLAPGIFLVEPVFSQGPPDRVSEELIVGLRPGLSHERAQALYHAHGAFLLDEIPQINTHLIRVPPQAIEAVKRALSRRPEFEFVENNKIFYPDIDSDDPYYSSQWHLPKTLTTEAWGIALGAGVTIAILDSGVDPAHPDLAEKLVEGYNAFDNNADTTDVYGHGTKVAGAAAALANNGTGVSSVAWDARIMPIRVTDANGWGYAWTISKGLTWAVDRGARVMNLSFSGVAGDSTIKNAAQYVVNNGGVVVAAAGNCGCFDSTSENPYIVSVSATDYNDNLASFSSYGNYVDVSAPGIVIYTTFNGGGYGAVSGTSFSSPITAGIVALIMSANPDLTPTEVMGLLGSTADDFGEAGYDTSYGYGRVNAYEAVLAAIGNAPPPDSTPPSVSIDSPADGVTVSGTINVSVSASDNTGVTEVALFLDGALLATDPTEPFTFVWDTTQSTDGPHRVQAKAYDAGGNIGTSVELSVTVDNAVPDATPPGVSIVSPVEGAILSGAVDVSVAASDDTGVVEVELYLDGALLAAKTEAPYVFTWDTTLSNEGTHTLRAAAYDEAGNVGYSTETTVSVQNSVSDTTNPTVLIVAPSDGSRVSNVVRVRVHASDDSMVQKVELYVDGKLLRVASCSASDCDLQFNWYARREGRGWHTLFAVAYDAAGHAGVSSTVSVYVK